MQATETVIGIEVHAQLATRTKAFCSCALPARHGEANRHVCPVCLGLPGALPVFNQTALRLAITAALALGCTVHERSVFARKSYFYPDLPKGYQISQLNEPLATGGLVQFDSKQGPRAVRITRLHLEDDAGKLTHDDAGATLVDLDRAGTPLAEIVSEPDLRCAEDAANYLRELRDRLLFVGACDGDLEAGNFRADINLSLRPLGSELLGTRVELKNLNSFRFVERAILAETARQRALLARGEAVRQETRGYDESTDSTVPLRSKEDAQDYRYFPDPDLPVLHAEPGLVAEIAAQLPALPGARREHYRELGVAEQTARVLTQHPGLAQLFEETIAEAPDPARASLPAPLVANFIAGEVIRDAELSGLTARLPLSAAQLRSLLSMVDAGTLSLTQAKELYAELRFQPQLEPQALATSRGMQQLSDESALQGLVDELVAANPAEASAYRGGNPKLMGFFVGKIMQITQKRANPALTSRLLRERLERDR